MATTWLPKNNFSRRSFLLADGQVVQEPALEETSTGMKIRLAGTKESFYSRDEETLIRKGLDMLAESRGTRLWMPLDLNQAALVTKAGWRPEEKRCAFSPTAKKQKAVAWWSFKHPTMPIEALLVIGWMNPNDYAEGHQIVTRLIVPHQTFSSLHPQALVVTNDSFEAVHDKLGGDWATSNAFEEFLRDSPAEWVIDFLRTHTGLNERAAVKRLARQVRHAEELDEIVIPDLRGVDDNEFDWLTLKLHDTNVNGQFINDMDEYLSGESVVDRARELYTELVQTFRTLGMVMDAAPSDNQFMQALLSGDKDALTLKITTPVAEVTPEKTTRDLEHPVSIHLPTGTFVVSCSKERVDKDEIAQAWEESLFLAQMTGKEDELLAYASEYVRTKHDRRANKIIGQRKTALAID